VSKRAAKRCKDVPRVVGGVIDRGRGRVSRTLRRHRHAHVTALAMIAITTALQAMAIIFFLPDREEVGVDGDDSDVVVETEVAVGGERVVGTVNAKAKSGLSHGIERQANVQNSVSYFTVVVENNPIGKGTDELAGGENQQLAMVHRKSKHTSRILYLGWRMRQFGVDWRCMCENLM